MAIDKKLLCPLLKSDCIEDGAIRDGELVACKFWVNVAGLNPQTGESINAGDCCLNWMPMLMIENTKINRETGAAIESFRNEMVKSNENTAKILLAATQTNNLIEVK